MFDPEHDILDPEHNIPVIKKYLALDIHIGFV